MAGTVNAKAWIAYSRPNVKGIARLFCFPYAGGGASVYRQWNGPPLDKVEVCPIQAPGRENRGSEGPFYCVRLLSKAVAAVIPRDKPFAFFGHSVGALLAFEVARELRREGATLPLHLFVSGASAPHLCPNRPPRFNLEREQLVAEIRKLGGTPHKVLADGELIDAMLPTIRADFALFDTYEYRDEEPFHFPMTAITGDRDPVVDDLETWQWKMHTTNLFRHHRFPGDHFFLHESKDTLRALIASEMDDTGRRCISLPAPVPTPT